MNLGKQNDQFQRAAAKFNEVSTIYDIHNIRIHAMINYFSAIKAKYAKFVSKKEKNQINKTKFGKQISNDPDMAIAPGNPGFQTSLTDCLINLSGQVVTVIDSVGSHIGVSTIKKLTDLVTAREEKYKLLTSKYNNALETYQKAQSNYKSSQQNLASALTKLEQIHQNNLAQQNQTQPQKGFWNKLKSSKSKTDVLPAIQSYRKCVRHSEVSVYTLNGAYTNFIGVVNECIQSFENDYVQRNETLRNVLYDLSTIYDVGSQLYGSFREYKSGVFQNEDETPYLQRWQSEFIQFITKAEINRLPIRSIEFNPVKPGESESGQFKVIKKVKSFDFPIGFARVTNDSNPLRERTASLTDFSAIKRSSFRPQSYASMNEIDINDIRRQSLNIGSSSSSLLDDKASTESNFMNAPLGQKVYIYNSLTDHYVLTSLSVKGPRRYIKNDCLTPIDPSSQFAIVKSIRLNQGEQYLRVVPGELVSISRFVEGGYDLLCKNLQGEEGLVLKECLAILS